MTVYLVARNQQQADVWIQTFHPDDPESVVVVNTSESWCERILYGKVWADGDVLCYVGTPGDNRVQQALFEIGVQPRELVR